MARQKRRLSRAEKEAKRRRRLEFETLFINGKQKRVRRYPTIDGLPADEFIRRNADPVWLAQNEMWEELYALEHPESDPCAGSDPAPHDDLPF
jgi:hypothetical protein